MLTSEPTDTICCRYRNQTSQFQVVRISNIPHCFFERTVIPEACILFETLREAQLEVHTSMMASAILSDVISCIKLAQISNAPVK
ncbi:MAG: DUF1830 domain-containing protein [Elainellaceae cyanobacterium]